MFCNQEASLMKTLVRPIVLVSALVIQFTLVGYAQGPASVDELRQQIQRLITINNDPNTDPDVRNINRGFLEQRRKQLVASLQKKLTTLQNYQAKVRDVLTNDEKQVLAQAAHDLESEIAALERTNPTMRELGSPTANLPGPSISAPPETEGSPPEAGSSGGAIGTDGATTSAGRASRRSSADAPQQDFNNWLDNRIKERIKAVAQARIDQRSNVNQTEAPAITDNSTSLVDQSSASDLIGVALNLSGLTGGNNTSDKDKNSAAVTATAYSLYSALRKQEPLDPSFYNKHRDWRRLSFTLGFEKGQTNGQGQATEDTTLAGAKYLIIAGRDAAKHQKELGTVYEYLKAAAVNFALLNKEIRNNLLFGDPELRDKLRIVDDVRFFIQSEINSPTLSDERKATFRDR